MCSVPCRHEEWLVGMMILDKLMVVSMVMSLVNGLMMLWDELLGKLVDHFHSHQISTCKHSHWNPPPLWFVPHATLMMRALIKPWTISAVHLSCFYVNQTLETKDLLFHQQGVSMGLVISLTVSDVRSYELTGNPRYCHHAQLLGPPPESPSFEQFCKNGCEPRH